MMRLLQPGDYINMPWKNGLGSTAQIHLVPESSRFPQDEFLWRISSAKVPSENQFSAFPGYDRLLAVWQGQGLILNQQKLEAFTPLHFAGETPVHCLPLGSDVVDLGVIFRRGKIEAQMTTENLPGQQSLRRNLEPGFHYFFCAQGTLVAEPLSMGTGSTLCIEGQSEIVLSNPEPNTTRFFHIYLRKIQPSEISS